MDEPTRVVIGGQTCRRLRSMHLAVDVAEEVGPRVLGLSLPDGMNLFAESSLVLDGPAGAGALYGGHRLWRAPEEPAHTWAPQYGPVQIEAGPRTSLTITGAPSPEGLQPSMEIVLSEHAPEVTVHHRLRHVGREPMAVAPWALTMLRPGGTAFLALDRASADEHDVQASGSHIVLWPYTDMTDPAIGWAVDGVRIDTSTAHPLAAGEPRNKLGVASTAGWCSYEIDGVVFMKRAAPPDVTVDGGANVQLFWHPDFVELETLGRLQLLEPGDVALHTETWHVEDLRGVTVPNATGKSERSVV